MAISCIPAQPRRNAGVPANHSKEINSPSRKQPARDTQNGQSKTRPNVSKNQKDLIRYKIFFVKRYSISLIPN